MLRSLVGSEMCIRDRGVANDFSLIKTRPKIGNILGFYKNIWKTGSFNICLLYTSDAADEEDSVDLGGRRIIKQKKKKQEKRRSKQNAP